MNPLAQLAQIAKQGQSIYPALMQMSRGDPRIMQALQMMQGRSPDQIRQMVLNMARERGIDLNQMAQMYGLRIPR